MIRGRGKSCLDRERRGGATRIGEINLTLQQGAGKTMMVLRRGIPVQKMVQRRVGGQQQDHNNRQAQHAGKERTRATTNDSLNFHAVSQMKHKLNACASVNCYRS
jgi:hypothetical protein